MQRHSCAAETAARIVHLTHDLDIRDLLPQVRVPTLVMHSTHDARIPFELGRALAAGISGAQFVPLESAGHNLMQREPAFAQFFSEIERFVSAGRGAGMQGLTPRETELLHHLARGRSNEEIAQAMKVASKTVRNVVSVLFDKLEVRTRAEAIVRARESGFGED
jgi:DNA-binding NarL/FixJ family response regulator